MAFQYLEWIKAQPSPNYTITVTDEDHLKIDADTVNGEVNIYHLEKDIAELRLIRKSDGENAFFLHFELQDEAHAKQLFSEMQACITSENNRKTTNVLLTCTSALTTSYFAEKLNEAAATLSLDYHFDAVSFPQLYEKGFSADVILLAPQVGFQLKKVQSVYHQKVVLTVPARIFASYDAGAMVDLIKEELGKAAITKEQIAIAKVMRDVENNACLFVITMTHDLDRTYIGYRIYDHGEIAESQRIVKGESSLLDVKDILNTFFAACRKKYTIDAVVLSIPGVTLTDADTLQMSRIDYGKVAAELSDQYQIPFFVSNNTNTVALGYYAQQNDHDIVTYYSMPSGSLVGGEGMVYEGKVIEGSHQMAGEVEYVFPRFMKDADERQFSMENLQEIIISYFLANISVIDPDVILLRSDLTADLNEIEEELLKHIRKEDMPELILVRNVDEYAFLGTMLYGLEKLKQTAVVKKKGI